MILAKRLPGRWNTIAILGVLTLFVAIGLTPAYGGPGDDLSSSYVGCRLLASGQADQLYNYDPVNFPDVGDDDAWQAIADQTGFSGSVHPYVQTPLWAYALGPLCMHTRFPAFYRVFRGLALLCFAASLWLVARFWAPLLYTPIAVGVAALALLGSVPFRYACFLNQTHVYFFLATIAALMLAERRRPVAAGLLLALAAAVKITPAAVVLYWLLTRRYKAAASMVLASAVLVGVTLATTGQALFSVYLADLHRVSRVLLVSINNQSFAAWWMGRFYPGELGSYHSLPLPEGVRLASSALLLAATVCGGLIDRRPGKAPLGAMIALVGATLFAPIAWTHYSVILVAPCLVIAQGSLARGRWWPLLALVPVAALNFPPLATDVVGRQIGAGALVRSEFYAGMLCLLLLGSLARLRGTGGSTGQIRSDPLP